MKKFTTLLLLTVLMTVAYSDLLHEFRLAASKWMKTQQATLDQYNRFADLYDYYVKAVGNSSCLEQFEAELLSNFTAAAVQWSHNKSQIGSIVVNLTTVTFPSLSVKGKRCTNPDIFRRDENAFNALTAAVLANNTYMNQTYYELSDEIGFLTKGQIASNQTCVQRLGDLLEMYRLSTIVAAINATDGYLFAAKMVYAYLPNLIMESQKCLIGGDEAVFNQAYSWFLQRNPAQKTYFNQLDDQIGSLTKILYHDDVCAQALNKKVEESMLIAFAQFRNGTSRIGDLTMKLLHVTLAETVVQARGCLNAGY